MKKILIFEILAAIIIGGISGFYFSPALLPEEFKRDHHDLFVFFEILCAFWAASTPIFIVEGIKFFINNHRLSKQIDTLTKTGQLFYKDRFDDLFTFLTEFKEPVKDLLKLDKFSTNGFNFTHESLKEMVKSGIANVNSSVADYIDHLEKVLRSGNSSIYLTCTVPPQWFFANKDDTSLRNAERTHNPLTKSTKTKILIKYRQTNVKDKVRIVIYDSDDISQMGYGQLSTYKKGATDLMNISQFKHYWTTEELLRNNNTNYVIEDYAIFDQIYFLQYNLKSQVLRAGWNQKAVEPRKKLFDDISKLKTNQYLFETFDQLIVHLGIT